MPGLTAIVVDDTDPAYWRPLSVPSANVEERLAGVEGGHEQIEAMKEAALDWADVCVMRNGEKRYDLDVLMLWGTERVQIAEWNPYAVYTKFLEGMSHTGRMDRDAHQWAIDLFDQGEQMWVVVVCEKDLDLWIENATLAKGSGPRSYEGAVRKARRRVADQKGISIREVECLGVFFADREPMLQAHDAQVRRWRAQIARKLRRRT